MKHPLLLNEIEAFSRENEHLKPMLREVYRFPCDTPQTDRSLLRRQAIQRIDDIVMFHRFAMFTHSQNKESLKPLFDAFNEHYDHMFDTITDPKTKASARVAFKPFNAVAQLEQIQCIANESLVINLWATIEQISTRCLEALTDKQPEKRPLHKWHMIEKHYAAHHVDLKKAVSYNTVNELRELNNKIKHSYLVDVELAKFEFFEKYAGKKIDSVPLRVFDYTFAAYNFVCYLTNRTGESIFYPESEEDDDEV